MWGKNILKKKKDPPPAVCGFKPPFETREEGLKEETKRIKGVESTGGESTGYLQETEVLYKKRGWRNGTSG